MACELPPSWPAGSDPNRIEARPARGWRLALVLSRRLRAEPCCDVDRGVEPDHGSRAARSRAGAATLTAPEPTPDGPRPAAIAPPLSRGDRSRHAAPLPKDRSAIAVGPSA